jgi:hypothetical protein
VSPSVPDLGKWKSLHGEDVTLNGKKLLFLALLVPIFYPKKTEGICLILTKRYIKIPYLRVLDLMIVCPYEH